MRRRDLLALAALAPLAPLARAGDPPARATSMRTREVPRTGRAVPVVGLGTWRTFDVGASAEARAPLAEVLRLFFAAGGALIDSSPMYGRAESVVGDLVAAGGHRAFFATKVWTTGERAGREQMRASARRLRAVDDGQMRVDLMQVHNLVDVATHLPVLRELKAAGRIGHIGVTHYARSAFDQLERLLKTEELDFVQLPYSVRSREVEERLLPAAAAARTAVIVMRPFEEGSLFRLVRGRPVPEWASDAGFQSWAELFLAFILGHPAVTCVIPATSKPHHLAQNVRAGSGPTMDGALRARLVAELSG